jgi:anti-sigma regulatory factor (Ser/Thr protein kinase)
VTERTFGGSFDLTFDPRAELASSVRQFVKEFCGRLLDDAEAAAGVALAADELMRNAVKASNQPSRMRIELLTENGKRILQLRSWNEATADDLDTLRRTVAALSQTGAARPSGGLARIVTESKMALEVVIENERVCVLAKRALAPSQMPAPN